MKYGFAIIILALLFGAMETHYFGDHPLPSPEPARGVRFRQRDAF